MDEINDDEWMSISYPNMEDITNEKVLIYFGNRITRESEYIVFSNNQMIDEILQSHKKDSDNIQYSIHKQIEVDFHRMIVYYNDIRYHDLNKLKKVLKKYSIFENYLVGDIYHLLLGLINQASFSDQTKILMNIYNEEQKNLYILQNTDTPTVKITEHRCFLELKFMKGFKLVNIETMKTYKLFQMITTIKVVIDKLPISMGKIEWITTHLL